MNIIQTLEKEQVDKLSAGKEIPDFGPGDTVLVNVKVVEGDKSRVQAYEGVCIGRSGGGLQRELHGAQDFLRRRRRARVPALLADDRLDQGRAPRQGASRQALLPARPARQEGPHHRGDNALSAPRRPRSKISRLRNSKGAAVAAPFLLPRVFIVGTVLIDYIAAMVSRAQRIILADHARLPWRFFGRLTAVQAGL